MSGLACRSCGVNAVSIRCLHCMEDRALMCVGCARHHNEIKIFHTHELVPLSNSFHELNTVQANSNHLNSVMGNVNPFRPNSSPNPPMSQMAPQPYGQREEAMRPPAYRSLISNRQGALPGQGPGVMGGGQGHNLGQPNPSISAGAYTSNIRNKVIHVTPATFHLIRSNALLLEDIKTCTGCKIFVSSASSHVTVTASVNAVELVGTNVQIEGAIKCLQDLTSALNSSKRKALISKFPGGEGPEGQGFDPQRSPHLGPQPGPPQGQQFNPQGPRPPGPWPPRGGEYPPQGYPHQQGPGQGHHDQRQLNARDQMLAREQLQLQRLYAHSTGNVGGHMPHPSNVGVPRLGASPGLTGSPRATPQPPPVGMGGRYALNPPQGQGLNPRPGTGGPTTLSATAAPFVFGQTQTQIQIPPTGTAGAAFLRSSGDSEAFLFNPKEGNGSDMDFEGGPGMNFNFEIEGGAAASGSGAAEESSEVEAMSRRFLTGLDEDMNHGLDTYSGFEEPFPFEDPSKTAALIEGSMTTRSYSPENPVLGDSGWDEDGEKVDLFPSPTKKSHAPLLPAVSASEPLSDIPAVPITLNVPVIISPATVVIPLGTARFTGFTSACQDEDSNPFQTGGLALPISPKLTPIDEMYAPQPVVDLTRLSLGDRERELDEPTSPFTPRSDSASVKESASASGATSNLPSARIECPFSKIGLLSGASGTAILRDIMENTHTDITIDFGGPPGLPRKVVITGTREADVGLANVLLSDVIATGAYVSFKESAGNHPVADPSLSFRDNGTEVMYDERVDRVRANSFGNPLPPGPDSLGYFAGNRGIDQVAPSPYSSLLNATTSQREAEMQRERDHYAGVNQNNFEFRSQFPGGPQGMEMSEREREMRMVAARYNGLPPSGNSNLAMTPQQQHLQLLQMTSRYPRLFPSASGGAAPPPGVSPLPPQGANGAYPGQIPGPGIRYPPPSRAPFDPRNGMRERGFEGHDDRLLGGPLDDPSDAMRSESLNRAIERANASTGVILGEMLCPAEKISLIIGTKGSIINEISRKSNTVISIVDDDSRINAANPYGAPNKSHRLIIIRGSDEGVETAKRYIAGVIASGPAYLNVEILSPSSYQNMAANMGMTVVGQEPFRGQGPPPGQYGRDSIMGQQQSLLRPGLGPGDFEDRYNPAAQGGPPGLAELIEFDREREERSSPTGPPGLTVNNGELNHHPTGSDEERDRLMAQAASPFWGSNGAHSQYGGMDGGRIAPPSQLSFTDLKNAGIMNNIDSGNTAPDPNSRRSMARFQTYLDRTHAQQNQQAVGSQAPSPVQPFAPPRIPPPTVAPDRGGYSRALSEVLDTLTCPLQKIPLLLGHKGATLRRIIDISGADIIINHELPPAVPRILELRGTEVQVNSAREMIENILESESNQVSPLQSDPIVSPPVKEDDEKLSTLDSHWMSMNAASFRVDGRSTDRFSDGPETGHNDSKEKEEYEALYGKFMLEDGPRDPSPARAAPSLSATYFKEAPTVFVDNGNYDEEDSLNSDDEIVDSLSLTQNVNFSSQQQITVVQANLGLLDKVANCTGTTVRLVSRNSVSGSSDSMPASPLRGPGVKLSTALATHSLDEAELTGSAPSRIASTSSSTSPSLSHIIMVSGLALQEVQSGVSVMRKVLHYLSALSGGTSNFKVVTSLLIEHVAWPGDTIKDLTKARTAAIKDIGTTSGAAVVLIRKFISSVSKETKVTGSVVIPPPALSITFADVLLKREPALPIPPPVLAPAPAVITFHHHVILIGSRFRIAAARTLLDKAMNCPEDLLLSTSTSSASSTVPSSVSNGMSMLRIPPPPRRTADTDSRGSDSDNDNSYDSEDDDDSYETGSGDDSHNGYSVSNGKQWSRLDNGESKRDGKRGDEKRERARRDDDESSNVVCILDCPNDKAGLVIGYKGSAIRTMSAKTRAKIVVTDAIINGGVSKRSVKIFGTRKQVEKARALVERLMEIGTDAFDEDYIPSSSSLKGVIVPTKETYITSATCAKQVEKENREKEKDRDGSASYQSVELEFPTDVLRRYLVSKNQEGVCKEIMNRFVVVVTFPTLPTVPLLNETFSIVKLKGSRSQLDRAGVYLKRGVGSFKDKDKDDRSVTESRSDRKKRSITKDRDSDNDDSSEVRRSKVESEKIERKSELKDREVVLDTTGPWKSLDREREEKKEKDKEEFVSVAVTVPCPASRAGCLIGSKGAVVKEIMRRTTARITISDEVILKLSPLALATNKDMTPDPTGYRWVTIKGCDDSVGAADTLVRSVIEHGAKALNK